VEDASKRIKGSIRMPDIPPVQPHETEMKRLGLAGSADHTHAHLIIFSLFLTHPPNIRLHWVVMARVPN